jgi:hypothetical protein
MDALASQLDLKTLMEIHKREIFTTLHCHKLGTIQEFDPATQTASITINHKAVVGDEVKDYPMLYEVPVFVPAGGDAALTMPVQKGDSCLVLFSDRDINTWFSTGRADAAPPTRRKHSIADGLAIVGFRPSTNPVKDYDTEQAVMRNKGSSISVAEDVSVFSARKISIKNQSQDLKQLLNNLLNILDGWRDTDNDTPNPATIAAIASVRQQLGELMK